MKVKRCEEILELLSLYIDNELDDVTAKAVEKHIESCSSCRSELEQLREIVKMCSELDEVELPDNFNEVLHERLKLEQKKMEDNKKTIFMRNRIMGAVASVAAIFILIFAVGGFMFTGMFNKTADLSVGKNEAANSIFNDTEQKLFEQKRDGASETESADEIKAFAYDMEQDKDGNGDSYKSRGIDSQDSSDESKLKMDSDSKISAAVGSLSTVAPSSTPGDEEVQIMFNEPIKEDDGAYSVAVQFNENIDVVVIGMTAYSNNFESDISTINEIACKFGTKIEESDINSPDSIMAKGLTSGENVEFTVTNKEDYAVSYTMDKLSYEKFIKEINDKYKGKYYVSNNEEELKNRLKDVEKRIDALGSSKESDTDEYKDLTYEKETILKQLDSINSSNKVRVNISIINNR